MEENDPLDQIIVRPQEIRDEQRALLAKLIFPFASIELETGDVHFKDYADECTQKQRIIVYLICRLALAVRTKGTIPAAVSPKEIEHAMSIPGGTLRPKLTQLVGEKIAMKSGEGYSVPAANLSRARKALETLLPEAES